MRSRRQACVAYALLLLPSCLAGDEPTPALVVEPQIIAVLSDPPEVEPGALARYQAIVAMPDGAPAPSLTWSYCVTPRALTDNAAVAQTCARVPELPLAGANLLVEGAVPADACARFGPAVRAGERPVDPDPTGGYYQPVRAQLATGQIAILRHRIRCPLANAPIAVAQDFAQRYRSNAAPVLATFAIDSAGVPIDSTSVPAGAKLSLRASLTADSAELYLAYDMEHARLVELSERLEVDWFVTAGSLSARTSSVEALSSHVRWRAPAQAGPVRLWLVVRDDRGGIAAQTFELTISELAPS